MAQAKERETRKMVRLDRELHGKLKAAAALGQKELAEALDEAVRDYVASAARRVKAR